MIYSKRLQTYIPVQLQKRQYNLEKFGLFTEYRIMDRKLNVGKVDLLDKPDGVKVMFVENKLPELYKGVGKVADQIEVEHCLKRGLKNFNIISEAAFNSHALHYLRGKRFIPEKFNEIVKSIIDKTPKGEKYDTSMLGYIDMFMPKELINKYIELIKKCPLLK